MPNTYAKAIILSVAVVAAGFVSWRFVLHSRNSAAAQMEALSPRNEASKLLDAGRATRPPAADRPQGSGASLPEEPELLRDPSIRNTVREQFMRAPDYSTFVASVLGAARDGDADSQFYLHSALQYCDEEYSAYFRKPDGGWRTLDEALVRIAVRPTERTSAVEGTYAKCHTLIRGDRQRYGDAQSWLERATAAGQPLAMATTASHQLLDLTNKESSAKQTTPSADPRGLLAAALKSKDPAVLWQIGELQGRLHGDTAESTKAQWAWWLAACQRGYECGEKSAWYEFSCRFDQMCLPGQTGIDYMRRTLQGDFAEVESMAKAINAKIDAGAWAELDIGS